VFLWLLAGATAFLLTCLGGHPLLTREAAYAPAPLPTGFKGLAVLVVVSLIGSIPWQVASAKAHADFTVSTSRSSSNARDVRFAAYSRTISGDPSVEALSTTSISKGGAPRCAPSASRQPFSHRRPL
jgi:uncharacterized SAM-binding protein YcdF (DUF218 family)